MALTEVGIAESLHMYAYLAGVEAEELVHCLLAQQWNWQEVDPQ
jgi:hypothetical protein